MHIPYFFILVFFGKLGFRVDNMVWDRFVVVVRLWNGSEADSVGGGRRPRTRRTVRCTALMFRNYSVAAYNMVAARLTDLRAADSTQVPFKK